MYRCKYRSMLIVLRSEQTCKYRYKSIYFLLGSARCQNNFKYLRLKNVKLAEKSMIFLQILHFLASLVDEALLE